MQINLLPDIVLKRRHDAHVKRLALAAFLGWTAFILVITLSTFLYRQIEKQRLDSSIRRYDTLNATVHSKENDAFRKEAAEVQSSLKALDTLFNKQERTSAVLSELSAVTPKGTMQINLLPDIVLKRRHDAHVKRLALAAFLGWTAFILVITLSTFLYRQIEKQRLDSSIRRYDTLNATVHSKENDAFRKEAAEVQSSLKALDTLFNKQERTSAVLSELSAVTPKGTFLTTLNILTNRSMTIGGSAASYIDVAKFVASLKLSEAAAPADRVYFTNIVLGGANLSDKGVSFTISTKYVYPQQGATDATKK